VVVDANPHRLVLATGDADGLDVLSGGGGVRGIVLSVADLVARLMLAPAELPIGIVTSLVGVPVFIYLLRKNQYYV
jgi:iron complex transport system permease protein